MVGNLERAMVAAVEFLVRQGKRWLAGCLFCCGKSVITFGDAPMASPAVSIEHRELLLRDNPELALRDADGQLHNIDVLYPNDPEEMDFDALFGFPGGFPRVAGLNFTLTIERTSGLRNATGVTLQNCLSTLEFPECLPGLVTLLFKDNQRMVQENAARALAELSSLQIRQWQIATFHNAEAGLKRLLSKKYSPRVREYAALALGNVGACQDIQTFVQRIAERPDALYHFVKALVPLLFRDDMPGLQDQACRALTDLSSVRVSLDEIGAAPNSIAGFVRLLSKSSNHYGQECAALTLSNLAISMDNTGRIVNCPGALPILIDLLAVSSSRHGLQESVTMTLTNLVYARENAITIMASPYFLKFLNGLTEILFRPLDDSASLLMQEMAAKTLMNLFVTKEIIEKMDDFPELLLSGLVFCLSKDQNHCAEYAAMALGNLALRTENTQKIADTPGALLSLVRLLLIYENPGGQKEAVFALLNLSHGDDNLKIKIAEFPSALETLVSLLSRNNENSGMEGANSPQDSTIQECAVDVLCNLTCVEQNSIKIAKFPGALEGLVALFLDDTSPVLQGKVAVVLSNLAIEAGNKVILAEFPNVLSGLVRYLFANESPRLQEYAAQALSRLTILESTQVSIVADIPEVLEGLVLLLSKHDTPSVQESAARGLKNLARAKENRVKLAEFPGAVAGLRSVIRNDDSPVLQETVIICLSSLAIEDKNKIAILEFPNMLSDLVELVSKCATAYVQGLSALVLGTLAQTSWRIQLKVVSYPDADVIALLTKLLNFTDDKSTGNRVAEYASWAIACLATAPENQRKIAQYPETTESLVRLINESTSSDGLKHPIATALASLGEEDQSRPAIVGAMEGLALLLDAEDTVSNKECRSFKWCAAKAFTLIDVEKGRSLILQSSNACGGRAEALLRMGMYTEALQDLDEANRLDSECGTTCSFRSFVKTMMEDCESALPDANKAVELEPEYLVRWSERGILRRIMGDLQGALEDLNKAIEMDFDLKGHYSLFKHRGYTKYLLGDEAGARADAEWALREDIPECVFYGRLPSSLGCLPVDFLGFDLK